MNIYTQCFLTPCLVGPDEQAEGAGEGRREEQGEGEDTAGREHQEHQETDQGILKIQLVESI